MELRIDTIAIPEQITFNHDELKAQLMEKVAVYQSMVYTEDQIKAAKKDRAALNALKKALNDERIRREREYMQPFNKFKAQIQDIIEIIDNPISVIDRQIKAFEEQQKAEKLENIRSLAVEIAFPVSLESVMDPKWLNSSVSLKAIREELKEKKTKILGDMAVIDALPEFRNEATRIYMKNYDLAETMREVNNMKEIAAARAAREAERQRAMAAAQDAEISPVQPQEEQPAVQGVPMSSQAENAPQRQWIGFQAYLSVEEAKALGDFLKFNKIQYKAI